MENLPTYNEFINEGKPLKEEDSDTVGDLKRNMGTGNSLDDVIDYLGYKPSSSLISALRRAGVIR